MEGEGPPQTTSLTEKEMPSLCRLPQVIVIIGMAGSGKTSFTCQLYSYLKSTINENLESQTASDQSNPTCRADTNSSVSDDSAAASTAALTDSLSGGAKKKRAPAARRIYTINLDPAVNTVPFPCNIDIRDSVDYKGVMKQYNLGPNGGTMTALNLFATRFHSVLSLIEKRGPMLDFILVDTPGQIEVFNWSASGTIILDSLASIFPLAICYVIDTVRCDRAVTFMSNMLYACSVLYKTKLPFIACFNKIDVLPHKFCLEWMENYEEFADAVTKEQTYMASFSRSCGLALMEFYEGLRAVGVSAATGKGFDDFIKAMDECRMEYNEQYVPWLNENIKKRKEKEEVVAKEHYDRFETDVESGAKSRMSDVRLTPKDTDLPQTKGKKQKPKTSNKFETCGTILEENEGNGDEQSDTFKFVDK